MQQGKAEYEIGQEQLPFETEFHVDISGEAEPSIYLVLTTLMHCVRQEEDPAPKLGLRCPFCLHQRIQLF